MSEGLQISLETRSVHCLKIHGSISCSKLLEVSGQQATFLVKSDAFARMSWTKPQPSRIDECK